MPEIETVSGHPTTADEIAAKFIGDTLEKAYPGWGWMVNVNSETGLIHIVCGWVNSQVGGNYGMTLKMGGWVTASELKAKVIRAGGEILERANLQRGRFSGKEIRSVDGVSPQHQPILSGI